MEKEAEYTPIFTIVGISPKLFKKLSTITYIQENGIETIIIEKTNLWIRSPIKKLEMVPENVKRHMVISSDEKKTIFEKYDQ